MSRIIVFGCGGVGSKARRKLEAEGNEIICFTDNSRSKWESSFEGKKVIAPQAILQENFDFIAIGIYKAAELIRRQLNEMGIDDEKIIVPIEPNRIFPNMEQKIEELETLEESAYSSRNTRAYQAMQIEIRDKEFLKRLKSLREVLVKNRIPRRSVCVVSGAVLQAFALRESKEFDDIDIIMTDDLRQLYGGGLVIVSDTAEMHIQNQYSISDDEIITDPVNYFVFAELKFMHPKILAEYTRKHNEEEYKLLRQLGRMETWS